MIERKIIIGLITSTAYLKKVRPFWENNLLESPTANTLGRWVIKHFDKYENAPGKDIETIFYQNVDKIDKDLAEEIEQDLLPDLSDEYVKEGAEINVDFLFRETIDHFNSRKWILLSQQTEAILQNTSDNKSLTDKLKEVEALNKQFKPICLDSSNAINLSDRKILNRIKDAFNESKEPLIRFPKQLGKFWNEYFLPGDFIGLLAPEKRGKTWLLLAIAEIAANQNKNIAFFQAGDMTEGAQLKRIGVSLLRKSYKDEYCREHYQPVRDCIKNQNNSCNLWEREWAGDDVFGMDDGFIKNISLEELKDIVDNNEGLYKPCDGCRDYDRHRLGAVWLKKIPACEPIEVQDVLEAVKKYFIRKKRNFMLSTHAINTLSVNDIKGILDGWEKNNNFIADIIIVDYADLLVPSIKTEFRHQQNQIWKELRQLSQTHRGGKLPLVITPTQADADSYDSDRLKLKNFSEDKRKYGHVTAMFGLNQDRKGREKALGLMVINKLIVREGDLTINNEVTVLQDLRQGRPILASYFQ